jgi:uncharacterized membrane protein YgaE (UPF0421/DUF939 family)
VSLATRFDRLRSKSWHIGQAAIAAGVAYFIAADVFDHPSPFFAPIAAVVSLGTSYGQRLRRVSEVTVGVAIGVLIADLLVLNLGSGPWQITLIVALAMSTALLIDAGGLFVTQAAVQSIVVAVLVPSGGEALLRWTDALIGGSVALVAATVVPGAPLRRPREQAARVVDKIAFLLRGAANGIRRSDVEGTMELLSDARSTDVLINELRQAADEGISVVRAAVAAYRDDPVPPEHARLCDELADAVEEIAAELRADRLPQSVQDRLVALGEATSRLPRSDELNSEVVLAQLRSIIADLLRLTGMGNLEATDAIPPLRS